MAIKIRIPYNTTAGAVPTAANMLTGELAVNTADGKLYTKHSNGTVVLLSTQGPTGPTGPNVPAPVGVGVCGPPSVCTTSSCFLKGSKIAMADGSFKNIEDVKIGDILAGANGSKNPVIALNRPNLGDRMMININNEHCTTLDHAHLRPNNSFGAVSLYEFINGENGAIQEVIIDSDGTKELWMLPGFYEEDLDLITQIELGDELVTIGGVKTVSSLEPVKYPENTTLYNFVMGGDHTYFVNGYCVTGFLNAYDFDYRNWKPNGDSWTAADYRNAAIKKIKGD